MVSFIISCPLVNHSLLCIYDRKLNLTSVVDDANANSCVLNQVMWVNYPEIVLTCVFVCGWWHPYTAIMCLRLGLSTMSHILHSVKAEIWGRGFYSGWSMNVHFLSGAVVLAVEQSGYVGRRTMLTHLPCSLTERLLPKRRQRALTLRLQQHPHAQQIIEMIVRKELCES